MEENEAWRGEIICQSIPTKLEVEKESEDFSFLGY